jgi:hypothetical protein
LNTQWIKDKEVTQEEEMTTEVVVGQEDMTMKEVAVDLEAVEAAVAIAVEEAVEAAVDMAPQKAPKSSREQEEETRYSFSQITSSSDSRIFKEVSTRTRSGSSQN